MIAHTLTPVLLHKKDVAVSRMRELPPDVKTRLVIVVDRHCTKGMFIERDATGLHAVANTLP
ncbi:MAG: hypothetical protein WB699_01420 [Bacteroidota bacterium]